MYFLRQTDLRFNLGIMMVIWMVTLYNYTLIQFLVNTFESIYPSAIASSISDIIGYLIGGWLFYKLGIRVSLGVSFCVSIVGAILVTLVGFRHESSWIFPILVTIAKLGISIVYQVIYVAHPTVFPTLFAATAFGLVQFVSNLFSMIAPAVAENSEEPIPMLSFMFLSALGGGLLLFLREGTGSVATSKF